MLGVCTYGIDDRSVLHVYHTCLDTSAAFAVSFLRHCYGFSRSIIATIASAEFRLSEVI
jgi:hypothetical protein